MRYTEHVPPGHWPGNREENLSSLEAAAKVVAKEIKRLRRQNPQTAIDYYFNQSPPELRSHPRVTTSLAATYLQMKDYAEAEHLLRETMVMDRNDMVAPLLLAVLEIKKGDTESAVRHIAGLIRYQVSEPALWILQQLSAKGSHSADQLLTQALQVAERHQLIDPKVLSEISAARYQASSARRGGRQRFKPEEEDEMLEIIGRYARSKMFTTNLIPHHINYTAKWVGTGQGPE